MDRPADSTAKLCQGGKGRYVGREGIPMDDSSRKECEPVIVCNHPTPYHLTNFNKTGFCAYA